MRPKLKTTKRSTLTSDEVREALQSTYPAFCEGTHHRLYVMDEHIGVERRPRPGTKDLLVIEWEEGEDQPKEKTNG